jgi:hypothetical protein
MYIFFNNDVYEILDFHLKNLEIQNKKYEGSCVVFLSHNNLKFKILIK